MKASELFDKKIVFMTGKGGVGKTTVSAALAYAARERGKKVCLVEVDRSPNMRYIFDTDIPVYKETQVDDDIWVLTLEPYKALEEYIGLQIKVPGAARMFLGNRIVHYFMNVAPGWRELITMGKIWDMQDHSKGRKKNRYDMLIIDAPATGHGLSFLRVPAVFSNIIKFGRMQGQTFDVLKMVTDRNRTVLNVVTLPEEMPVNEAISLHETANQVLNMQTGVTFVNGMHPPVFDGAERKNLEKLNQDPQALARVEEIFGGRVPFDAARDMELRTRLNEKYLSVVRERIGEPVATLPHLYPGRVELPGVKKLASQLTKQMA